MILVKKFSTDFKFVTFGQEYNTGAKNTRTFSKVMIQQ